MTHSAWGPGFEPLVLPRLAECLWASESTSLGSRFPPVEMEWLLISVSSNSLLRFHSGEGGGLEPSARRICVQTARQAQAALEPLPLSPGRLTVVVFESALS